MQAGMEPQWLFACRYMRGEKSNGWNTFEVAFFQPNKFLPLESGEPSGRYLPADMWVGRNRMAGKFSSWLSFQPTSFFRRQEIRWMEKNLSDDLQTPQVGNHLTPASGVLVPTGLFFSARKFLRAEKPIFEPLGTALGTQA